MKTVVLLAVKGVSLVLWGSSRKRKDRDHLLGQLQHLAGASGTWARLADTTGVLRVSVWTK